VGKREEELARLTSQVIRHFVQKTVVGDIAMFQQSSAQPQYPHAQRSQYGLHYRAMNDPSASFLQFLKGQEICQIAFGMYDLQINWGNGGLSCTGRVLYEPSEGAEVVWTEGHPFDAVPVLRLLQQTVEEFDNPAEGVLRLQFSNGDRLTVAREDGPEAFTIHHSGKPIIVG